MPECGKMVDGGGSLSSYPCIIAVAPGAMGHEGPCASRENAVSMRRRQTWESEQSGDVVVQAPAAAPPAPPASPAPPAPSPEEVPLETFQHTRVGAVPQAEGLSPVPGAVRVEDDFDPEEPMQPPGNPPPGTPAAPADLEITHVEHRTGAGVNPRPWYPAPVDGVPQRHGHYNLLHAHLGGLQVHGHEDVPHTLPPVVTGEQTEAQQVEVEGLRRREGDQPLPTKNNHPIAHEQLIAELLDGRLRLGMKRYGQGLQPLNGRDAVRDAMEEAADLLAYLMTLTLERDLVLGLLDEMHVLLSEPLYRAVDGAAVALDNDQVRMLMIVGSLRKAWGAQD